MLMNVVVAIAMDGGDQDVPGLKELNVNTQLIYSQFKTIIIVVLTNCKGPLVFLLNCQDHKCIKN